MSRIKTIRSHDGERGFRDEVFQGHLTKLLNQRGKSRAEFLGMGSTILFQAKRRAWNKITRESACEAFVSCIFIHNSDDSRYKQLKKDQYNSYLVGKFIYTDTLIDANKLVEEWKGGEKKSAKYYNYQQQPNNE